jgi:hypothetical protein
MPLSLRHKFNRLPKRFPVGTTFVVEGQTVAGDDDNNRQLLVFSRFVVLPGGRRIDLGPVSGGSSRVRRTRNRTPQTPQRRRSSGSKKIVTGGGTTLRQCR